MATTETGPPSAAPAQRKVDAFVFDCVCHIFNFDPANAIGPPGPDVRRAPLRVPPVPHHARARRSCRRERVHEGVERRRDLRHGHRGLRHGHDRRPAAAAHRPLPRRPLALGEVRRDGPPKHPDRAVFWGSVNPLEGKKALDLMKRQVEDHGAKAFKFYNVRYDYGQPFPWRMDDPRDRLPGVRAGAEARGQPDRRPQGRAARAAAGRAHAHVRHGRRGGQLPGHQLRDLPRRAAVARRGAVADRPLPEPLRVDRRDRELHLPPAAGLRRDARAR